MVGEVHLPSPLANRAVRDLGVSETCYMFRWHVHPAVYIEMEVKGYHFMRSDVPGGLLGGSLLASECATGAVACSLALSVCTEEEERWASLMKKPIGRDSGTQW